MEGVGIFSLAQEPSVSPNPKQPPQLWNSPPQNITCTLSQPYLVAEDFNLAVGSVHGLVTPVVVAVGVDLQVQGQAFHPLLRGEIRAEAVHRNENLQERKPIRHKCHGNSWQGATQPELRAKCRPSPSRESFLSFEVSAESHTKQYHGP